MIVAGFGFRSNATVDSFRSAFENTISKHKFSKPLVKLEKGRLVIIKKCEISWCKIETDDYIGWIDTKNVWGI